MVKEGYKLTGIGIIPEDWEIKSYDDVFKFLPTATYSRANLSNNGDIQYLHYGDIHTKYHFILDFEKETLPKISEEQGKKYPLLKNGDVVMADASEDYDGICKSVEVQGLDNKKAIAGLHTFLLRDTNNEFVNGFRGYLSTNPILKRQFDKLATGMKVYGVSKNNLKTVLIPIPPKPEQKAIAQALLDIDGLIASLEALIKKKEYIKTATMQQLLTGKKRLDGFSGKWVERKLGEIFDITAGKDLVKSQYSKQKDEFYKYPIYANSVEDEGVYGYANFSENKAGCITVTARGTLGVAFDRKEPFVAIGRLIILTPKIKLNSYYVTQVINHCLNFANESTSVPQLTAPQISKYSISLPKLKEQQTIAKILSDMDKEIEALKIKLKKIKAIKRGMMQELLTGRIRLIKKDNHDT